jgi:hypothetical protein
MIRLFFKEGTAGFPSPQEALEWLCARKNDCIDVRGYRYIMQGRVAAWFGECPSDDVELLACIGEMQGFRVEVWD